jgi:hypothetical protein
LHVILTVANGRLSLSGTAGLTFLTGTGSGDASMDFTGTAANINAALNGMTFMPSDVNGNLAIAVSDQGYSGSGGTLSATANIGIEAINAQTASTSSPILAPPRLTSSPATAPATPSDLPISNPQTTPTTQLYANQNSMNSLTQNTQLLRPEQLTENKTISRNVTSIPIGNPQLQQNDSFNFSDYLSHDKYQTYVIPPLPSKFASETLSMHSVLDTQILWKQIKAIAAQGESLPWLTKINVGTAIGISAGLSAGYIMMAFRWGALITSGLATTFPVWQWIDPLPILESSHGKSDEKLLEGANLSENSLPNESLESFIT